MKQTIPWKRLAAEFVVIVVGVLVALAVDRWREAEGEKALRREYVDLLILDVSSDITALDVSQTTTNERASRVLRAARGEEPHPDSAIYLFYSIEALQWYNPPVVSREAYDDLVNTGSLVLLDPAVRRVLGQYYDHVTQYERREKLFGDLLASGYRRVPPHVLGPDLHPELFDRIQRERERGGEVPEGWVIPADSVRVVWRRLRLFPDIETRVGERLYVDRQHTEIYGSRLLGLASELHHMLVGIRDGTIAPEDVGFTEAALGS